MPYRWSEFWKAHKLHNGYKVIVCCERRWVFNTVILSEKDIQQAYHWSEQQNPYWQDLYLTDDDLQSACLPSDIHLQSAVIKIEYMCGPPAFAAREFEKSLHRLNLENISIRMGTRTWKIPSNEISLQYPIFEQLNKHCSFNG